MSELRRGGRMRAYLEFVAAVLYFFVARSFAFRFAAVALLMRPGRRLQSRLFWLCC